MKAVGLYRYLPITDDDSLVDVVIEIPKPTGRDMLVAVRAISVKATLIKYPKSNFASHNPLISKTADFRKLT